MFEDVIDMALNQHGHVTFSPYITQDPVWSNNRIINFDHFLVASYDVYAIPFKILNLDARQQ